MIRFVLCLSVYPLLGWLTSLFLATLPGLETVETTSYVSISIVIEISLFKVYVYLTTLSLVPPSVSLIEMSTVTE